MSSISSAVSNDPSNEICKMFRRYGVPSAAASCASILVLRDLIMKSAQQIGKPLPSMTIWEGMRRGVGMAPIVGGVVGLQIALQGKVEQMIVGSHTANLGSTLASSAIIGASSAPFLYSLNAKTMGRVTLLESLRGFSPKSGLVITGQETAFVAGLCAADKLAVPMKKRFGDSRMIDYTAACVASAIGSVAGHPFNTILTCSQSGVKLDISLKAGSLRTIMRGCLLRTRALTCFSVVYTAGKQALHATLPDCQAK